ncbi:MAG: pyridoxamine 5'-phosphate oxidase family protein [Gammaproteobacteria bacterium]|nr:pyridoxamine 5'-phosphate oxidase family protein [Gammaproteobacteria bacterium]
MYQAASEHLITTTEQLEILYGEPMSRALTKELDKISDHYRVFIEKAPFVVVATSGPEGLDCSPRGDPPGFVRVLDNKTLLIPDRRGNNRIDTLRNIVRDPRISLLFLIPGVGETMRINGTAVIDTDPQLCESFTMKGKLPRSVITVTVERIYFQCQKALARSHLWDTDAQIPRTDLPSTGAILQALSNETFDGDEYDRTYGEHMKKSIY